MFAKQLIASPSESLSAETGDEPFLDAGQALRLLQRHGGFAPWKIIFPGSVVLSPSVCGMLGIKARAEPAPLAEFVERYHPEDRGKLLYLIAQALEGQRGFHSRLRVTHPTAGERMIESFADLRVRDGRVTELFGLSRDVTEDMERESVGLSRARMTQDMIANMPAPVLLLDEKLRIVDCNKYWLRSHRQADRKDVVGRSFNQLFPDLPAETRTEFVRAQRGEVVQTKRPFTATGTNRPMTCSAVLAPWYVTPDQIGGVMVLIGWSELAVAQGAVAPAAPAESFGGSLLELANQVD